MNQMLPRPKFWDEAALQDQTRFTMLGELLVFWLLFLISVFGQSLILSFSLIPWFLHEQGNTFGAALASGRNIEQTMNEMMLSLPDWTLLCDCFAYAAVAIVSILYCRRAQNRTLSSMGLRGGFLSEYLLGMVVGALIFAGVLAIGVWVGAYHLNVSSVSVGQLPLVLCALLGCAVQGASMELLIHGYFAPSVAKQHSPLWVLLISAIAATMLHSSLTTLFGFNSLLLWLILGVWVLKRGSLWGACAIYGVWLFANNFLCCFAPAGEHTGIYLFAVETAALRSRLTGAQGGPPAGICATVVFLAVLMLILALRAKDPAPPTLPQDEEAANIL